MAHALRSPALVFLVRAVDTRARVLGSMTARDASAVSFDVSCAARERMRATRIARVVAARHGLVATVDENPDSITVRLARYMAR